MKKILLITTGGTIASVPTEDGLSPQSGGMELLEFVPDLRKCYELDVLSPMNIESSDLKPSMWGELVQILQENYEAYDGFVITHGTDTLAYTSSALSYLVQHSEKPIVVTGSQYPIQYPITDARQNLRDSIVFAGENHMGGIFVVFNGKVMLGNRVKKLRSKHYEAFSSINYPDVARILEDRVISYALPEPSGNPVSFCKECSDEVFLLKLYPGIRVRDFSFVSKAYRAVLVESYGVGGVMADIFPLLQEWAGQGVILVIGTQCAYDGSDMDVYTVGHQLANCPGVMECRDMTTEAAMVKLMYLLAQTDDPKEIRRRFYTPMQNDIQMSFPKEEK